jgi:hypothetical protein
MRSQGGPLTAIFLAAGSAAHKKSFATNIPVYTPMPVVTIPTRKRTLHEEN